MNFVPQIEDWQCEVLYQIENQSVKQVNLC